MLILTIIILAVFAGLGYAVAKPHNKGLGATLGFLLGPIGVLIAAVMK